MADSRYDPSDSRYDVNSSSKIKSDFINILLMGETGVGKSTFINSLANYLTHQKLDEAKNNLITLIPTSFMIFDKDVKDRHFRFGQLSSDSELEGESDTKFSQCYSINLTDEKIINLIDTPGIGDTEGKDQDQKNLDDILLMISNFKELHSIFILMTTTHSRLTENFKYCIEQLLYRLDKSVKNNIVFIFTNSSGTGFLPGHTLAPLKKFLKDLKTCNPFVDINIDQNTRYCFDNHAISYLTASNQGILFNQEQIVEYERCWEKSKTESVRLLKYVLGSESQPGLKPHKTINTVCVNEARRMIMAISYPLTETIVFNEENKRIHMRHKLIKRTSSKKISDLEKDRVKEQIDLKRKPLDHRVTVCTAPKCSERYDVHGFTKLHYKTICHKPCDCTFSSLWYYLCKGINVKGYCKMCGCPSSKHIQINYESRTVKTSLFKEKVNQSINNEKRELKSTEEIIKEYDEKIEKINKEVEIMWKTAAKFAIYLKRNALSPFNDFFKDHLKNTIDNNNETLLSDDSQEVNKRMKEILCDYKKEVLKLDSNKFDITTEDIIYDIENLRKLELNGFKIRIAHDSQLRKVSEEHYNSIINEVVISAFRLIELGFGYFLKQL